MGLERLCLVPSWVNYWLTISISYTLNWVTGIEGRGWDKGGEDKDWGDNDLTGDESIGEGSTSNLFGNSVV